MTADVRIVWEACDSDGVVSQLVKVNDREDWQLSMIEGPFAGYPTIDLNREEMIHLHKMIGQELNLTPGEDN